MLARLLPILLSLPGLVVAVTGAKIPPAEVIADQVDEGPESVARD